MLLELRCLKGIWIFTIPSVMVTSIQNPIPCDAFVIHQQHFTGKGWLEMLRPAAVAIFRTLFNTHNTVAVVQLEHAVQGMDTTAAHATTSPPFNGKCGENSPTV
jgi:hypothetical protein